MTGATPAPRRRLRVVDRRLLGLLAEHGALTSRQLMRLTGVPERTVQYRLGRLADRGLIGRVRPAAVRGTSPYHCWLTGVGADAVGGGRVRAWAEEPARMRAVAALGGLWLALHDADAGGEAALRLLEWRRTADGVTFPGRAGQPRQLRVDAVLLARLWRAGGTAPVEAAALVRVDDGRVPSTRLAGSLAGYVDYLAGRGWYPTLPGPPVLLVLTRRPHRAAAYLSAATQATATPPAHRPADAVAAWGAAGVAVCALADQPAAAVSEAVWQRAGVAHRLTLREVLAAGPRRLGEVVP